MCVCFGGHSAYEHEGYHLKIRNLSFFFPLNVLCCICPLGFLYDPSEGWKASPAKTETSFSSAQQRRLEAD